MPRDGRPGTPRAQTPWMNVVRLGMGLLPGLVLMAQGASALPARTLSLSAPRSAQANAPSTNLLRSSVPTGERVAELQVKLAEAQADLNRVVASLGASTNLPPGATAAEAIEYPSALQRLVRTYQLHVDDLAALEASRQGQEELSQTIQSWAGFDEPPPYSVLFVNDLRDTIQSLAARIRAAQAAGELIAKLLAAAEEVMTKSDESVRRLNEELEGSKEAAVMARLTWQRELERARGRVAAANLASLETKRQTANVELAANRQRLAFARRQLGLAARQVRFSQADLDTVMSNLTTEQRELEGEIGETATTLDARQRALAQARETLRNALREAPGAQGDAAAVRHLQEEVEVRDIERRTSAQTLTVLRQLLEGIGHEREVWQTRFALFGSRDLGELQEGNRRLRWLSGLIEAAKPYYLQQLQLAANQVAEEQKRLLSRDGAQADAVLARDRLQSYRQLEALYFRAVQGLEKRERAVLRWREALDFDRETLPFTERVRDLFTEGSTFLSKLWNLELFVAEDTIMVDGQPIPGRRGVTLGKIVAAILILAVGYWVSGLVARLLERLARRRLKVEPNQANLIRRWVRVVLVMVLIVFSLVSVKIPLTVFAFAGGALAIGAGFGMQNLLKNFISGIVILFERPFRVGDVLTVEDHSGTVISIGIRSSVVQRWDGTETLIPNSTLLEHNLTNWTYSNRTVRFTVRVGVAYGSDPRRVAQLLAEVADRHGLVEKEPKPQILFTEFGDSALVFELRYWVHVLKQNAAQIGSDLRHMIATTFDEQGVVIPFPQRDVRLTAEAPVAVRLVSPGAGQEFPRPATPAADATTGNISRRHAPAEPAARAENQPSP